MAPKNKPTQELCNNARIILSNAIKADSQGIHLKYRPDEVDVEPLWKPKENTLSWTWSRRYKCFAFSIDSTDNQVDAYWVEGADKAYVAHNGQQRHIATLDIMSQYSPWDRVI